jgi:hypothetical protein
LIKPFGVRVTLKFNALSLMEDHMTRSKKRSSFPAVAFIYLGLIGAMVLLSASRAFAI